MTDIAVNTNMLVFSMIMLIAVVLVLVGYHFYDKRLTSRGEREIDESFEVQRDIATRPRPAWDGETWQQAQGYQDDPWVYSRPQPRFIPAPRFVPARVLPSVVTQAQPVCPASGPMPGLDASLDTDAFIASMRAETDRWISYYSMAELAGV